MVLNPDTLVPLVVARELGIPPADVGHFIVIAEDLSGPGADVIITCCRYTTTDAPAILRAKADALERRARGLLS